MRNKIMKFLNGLSGLLSVFGLVLLCVIKDMTLLDKLMVGIMLLALIIRSVVEYL